MAHLEEEIAMANSERCDDCGKFVSVRKSALARLNPHPIEVRKRYFLEMGFDPERITDEVKAYVCAKCRNDYGVSCPYCG